MASLRAYGARPAAIAIAVAICWVAAAAYAQGPGDSEEIPIERCDILPVVRVKVVGSDMRFLLDTGATTILNLKSFPAGASKLIHVDSWKGAAATSAREVSLHEIRVGSHVLHNSLVQNDAEPASPQKQ